tara:strand:- start:1236 stop:2027 length:792 start_codon:yes stop_codon:yes gene_type:complete
MKLSLETKKKVMAFSTIFKNLKNIVDEINITFKTDKIYMQGMDNTHALLFEMVIQSEWFDKYETKEEDTFGLHCATFFQIINCLKDDQTIEMLINPNSDYLTIKFVGEDQICKTFELSRIDIDVGIMDIPEVEYEADMCFASDEFSELIKETSIFNDTLNIKCNEESIEMIAQGNLGKMTATIKEDDIVMFSIEEDCSLDINYTLGFLNNICGFCKLNNEILIHCSDKYPMKIQYNLDDTNVESEEEAKSYCRFFIAPKIVDN